MKGLTCVILLYFLAQSPLVAQQPIPLWERPLQVRENAPVTALIEASNTGDFFIGGYAMAGEASLHIAYLRRIDHAGNDLWTRVWESDDRGCPELVRVLATADGGCIALLLFVECTGYNDFIAYRAFRFDPAGNERWSTPELFERGAIVAALGETPDGGCLIAANVNTPYGSAYWYSRMAWVRIGPSGLIEWQYGEPDTGSAYRFINSMRISPDGSAAISGIMYTLPEHLTSAGVFVTDLAPGGEDTGDREIRYPGYIPVSLMDLRYGTIVWGYKDEGTSWYQALLRLDPRVGLEWVQERNPGIGFGRLLETTEGGYLDIDAGLLGKLDSHALLCWRREAGYNRDFGGIGERFGRFLVSLRDFTAERRSVTLTLYTEPYDLSPLGTTVIEAEDYRPGGEGIGYHDTTPGNTGGAYRHDDVDIEPGTVGGRHVGWIDSGEWLAYDIDVPATGAYDISLRVARAWYNRDSYLHLESDGRNVTGKIFVPDTEGFQNWTTVTARRVRLVKGVHTLKLVMDGNTFNVDRIGFTFLQPAQVCEHVIRGSGSSVIEAEDYTGNVTRIDYFDTTPGNTGGAYRNDDVDIEPCSEGGFNIGWIEQGEWLLYRTRIESAGVYTVSFRVARAWHSWNSYIILQVDGRDVTGLVFVPDTHGFQSWTTVTAENVRLPAGHHQLRLVMEGETFNVNWIGFRR